MNDFKLNEMQQVASEKFQEWYKHPEKRKRPWFEISGAAGTGKTTVVKHIISELGININDVVFMAFVGKAALALRLSGVNGKTIHSVIYKIVHKYKTDYNGNIIYRGGKAIIDIEFELRESLPENIKLLVVDEGGMISSGMGQDILSFGIPTLVLGDTHQLPPVFGNGLFLLQPDVVLNEIMRQSKDSSIIYLSQLAMHGISIPFGSYNHGESNVIKQSDLTDDMLRQFDLIICNTNKTRDLINWYIRKNIYGFTTNHIEIGDKLICRQNCWDTLLGDASLGINIALVNGLIGTVTGVDKLVEGRTFKFNINFQPEFSSVSFKDLNISPTYALKDYNTRRMLNPRFTPDIMFELGYCTTCHLAQGSQYSNVLVYVDGLGEDSDYKRKWLYTAITRAQKNLTIAI